VGIVTNNIDELKDYYMSRYMVPISDTVEQVRIVKFEGLELIQYESQSKNNLRKKGISHIAFTEDTDNNALEVVTNATE